MAVAETLRINRETDDRVKAMQENLEGIDQGMQTVGSNVQGIDDEVQSVKVELHGVGDKVNSAIEGEAYLLG